MGLKNKFINEQNEKRRACFKALCFFYCFKRELSERRDIMKQLIIDLIMDIYSYFRAVYSAIFDIGMCFGMVLSPFGDNV